MKKFTAIFMCIFMVLLFAACGDIVSNRIDGEPLSVAEASGKTYIKSKYSYVYCLDFDNKTFVRTVEGFGEALDWSTENYLEYEFFAGEYTSTVPEGYNGIVSHILDCKLDDESSVVYAYGCVKNNALLGFVQVYKEASGVHGNYAVEKISHSVLFEYDLETAEFEIVDKINDVVAVAVHNNTAIYWKNKAYYQYDISKKTETLLTEDKAYDSGLQQQSWTAVLSNQEYCVIHFSKAKGERDVEYMFVYDFASCDFCELTFTE